MNLTPEMFLIVCPLLFLAGLVDAIGGGGGKEDLVDLFLGIGGEGCLGVPDTGQSGGQFFGGGDRGINCRHIKTLSVMGIKSVFLYRYNSTDGRKVKPKDGDAFDITLFILYKTLFFLGLNCAIRLYSAGNSNL